MPTTGNQEISLYFHIPFCSKKCPYCHFYVLPNEERFKEPFKKALLQEWHLRIPQVKGKRVVSIYFGGGTPTKLPPAFYDSLLQEIKNAPIEIADSCEITLEANPEDVSLDLMQEFHRAGINRVSLGLQSLHQEELVTLGRGHTPSHSIQAIYDTYHAGIHNISIDLMFDVPHQTTDSWNKTLNALKELPITHLSLYNLVLEPHTLFFKKQKEITPHLPQEEESVKMWRDAIATLEAMGLARYEISAFAKKGYQSRHNLGYWRARPFLGFGPSAFSYWEGKRFSNTKKFHHYLNSVDEGKFPVDFEEELPFPDNLGELLAIELRILEGISLDQWKEMPPSLAHKVDAMEEEGYLLRTKERLRLTDKGRLFYDDVASSLI